jgi:hypothetical protein
MWMASFTAPFVGVLEVIRSLLPEKNGPEITLGNTFVEAHEVWTGPSGLQMRKERLGCSGSRTKVFFSYLTQAACQVWLDEAQSHQVFAETEKERHEFFSKITLPGDIRRFDPHSLGMQEEDGVCGQTEMSSMGQFVHPDRQPLITKRLTGTVEGLTVQFSNMTVQTDVSENLGGGCREPSKSQGEKSQNEDVLEEKFSEKAGITPPDFLNTPCTWSFADQGRGLCSLSDSHQ